MNAALLVLLLAACGGEDFRDTATPGMAFSSPAFEDGGEIPRTYTCEGEDRSPPLAWSGIPEGSASLAVVVTDPDAHDCSHWAVYDLPAELDGLDEGASPDGLPGGARELRNYRGERGYAGPCPPERHTYLFRLFALSGRPELGEDASFDELLSAIEPLRLGEASFTGWYEPGE